jgi:glycosyltransferase involved in cell wall biosynthesis
MKILFFIDGLGSGGAQRQMVTIACLLKNAEYDVSFLIYDDADFFANILQQNGIGISLCHSSNYLSRIWKVRSFIRKGNYDAVISFLDTPNFLNCISAIGGKKWKIITSERSAKESNFLSKRGKLFGWVQRYSDKIVCNSENARQIWLKYCPRYADKLTTIYNTVQLPSVTTEYVPRRNGKLHLVVVASYQYLKNPTGLVQALTLLNKDDREKIEIDWYGNKKVAGCGTRVYNEALQLMAANHLKDVIRLSGTASNVQHIMNDADMVSLFSQYEGLPNAICEAMMIGKPIIMTRVSDYDVLVDDSNGFLCDWNSPESIKDALIAAINLSAENLLQMGENSKRKAEKLFSSEKIINQWINLINS